MPTAPNMQTIYTRIIPTNNLPTWYAACPMVKATPEKTVAHLNKVAQQRGIEARYELCTRDEWAAYRLGK